MAVCLSTSPESVLARAAFSNTVIASPNLSQYKCPRFDVQIWLFPFGGTIISAAPHGPLGDGFQNMEFINDSSRKPYDSQLKPLFHFWKSMRSRRQAWTGV